MGTEALAPAAGPVTKPAIDAVHAARIVAEAEVLAAAQVPGVVELLGVEGEPGRPVLVTARVDGPDLARTADFTIEEVGGLVAAVATILADLHDVGLVHGAVLAEHVLVAADGRPVLCGFGYAARSGQVPLAEAPLPEEATDPARRPGEPLTGPADVYALGALLRALVAAVLSPSRAHVFPTGRSPGPAGGGGTVAGRRPSPGARAAAAALRPVADRAMTADPALRPSARSMAAAVGAAVPDARLPRRPGLQAAGTDVAGGGRPLDASTLQSLRQRGASGREPPRVPGRRRRGVVAGLAAAAVAAGIVFRVAATTPTRSRPQPLGVSTTTPAGAPQTTVVLPATAAAGPATGRPSVPVGVAPQASCPAVSALLFADTDGDGCPEALGWRDGVVEAGDRRWAVGEPGDEVASADWSCSGQATLALLRPRTGQVFVFPGWAEPGHDLVATVAARVDGGFALRAAELGDGCPQLVVERNAGLPVTVTVPQRP